MTPQMQLIYQEFAKSSHLENFSLQWGSKEIKDCSIFDYQIIQLILCWGQKLKYYQQESGSGKQSIQEFDTKLDDKLLLKGNKGDIKIDYIEVYLEDSKKIYVLFGEHDEKAHYELAGYTFLGELLRWVHCLRALNTLREDFAQIQELFQREM